MATFAENIRKIRGEAIYGPDMRTAIAEALVQTRADGVIDQEILDQLPQLRVVKIAGFEHRLNFTNIHHE